MKWVYALAICCLASGCVNQRAEIAKYREILMADAPPEVPQLMPGEELTLLRALALANQDNENLMIRGEDFVQAMAEKDRAFGAFLPTISLNPSYTITHNPQAGATRTDANGVARPVGTSGGFKSAGRTLRRFELPVQGSSNLFNGFRDLATLKTAADCS
jgi:hypothetical protein